MIVSRIKLRLPPPFSRHPSSRPPTRLHLFGEILGKCTTAHERRLTLRMSCTRISVIDDDSSYFSLALALITLSPILLMASYAALAVQTREFLIITMWAGQFFGELLNWVIKRIIKQDRPIENIGNGYGFPSSHSQYMAYFTSFLFCHLYFRHRFSSTGYRSLDFLFRMIVYAALLTWTGLVAYSRYYLGYHNANQIFWGLAIGAGLGIPLYIVSQAIPNQYPSSRLGKAKSMFLNNSIIVWLRIRDGWTVWADGGRETEWCRWREEWKRVQNAKSEEKRQ